jgi:hypothetical protein
MAHGPEAALRERAGTLRELYGEVRAATAGLAAPLFVS